MDWNIWGPIIALVVGALLPGPQTRAVTTLLDYVFGKKGGGESE